MPNDDMMNSKIFFEMFYRFCIIKKNENMTVNIDLQVKALDFKKVAMVQLEKVYYRCYSQY